MSRPDGRLFLLFGDANGCVGVMLPVTKWSASCQGGCRSPREASRYDTTLVFASEFPAVRGGG